MPLQPWKVPEYTALLYQTGTNAPVATILYNTLGNIQWTRDSAGIYLGTLSGAFGQFNTFILCTDNALAYIDYIQVRRADNDTIEIHTEASGSLSDDILRFTPIRIQLYNIEN